MGCDYYNHCYLKIGLNDQTFKEFLLDESKIYANYSWDSDSEDDEKRQCAMFEARLLDMARRKDRKLYENGQWYITAKFKISEYQKLITNKNILFEHVTSIEKYNTLVPR